MFNSIGNPTFSIRHTPIQSPAPSSQNADIRFGNKNEEYQLWGRDRVVLGLLAEGPKNLDQLLAGAFAPGDAFADFNPAGRSVCSLEDNGLIRRKWLSWSGKYILTAKGKEKMGLR